MDEVDDKQIESAVSTAEGYSSLITRRNFLIGAGSLAGLAALGAGIAVGRSISKSDTDSIPTESDILSDELDIENTQHIEQLRDRAEQLFELSEQELAGNLLREESNIKYDLNVPRVRESMVWTSEHGVFPLVHPEGDPHGPFDELSPSVPVQKPLLVLLNLIDYAGIETTITSFATSDLHSSGSHHYQGRAADIRLGDNSEQLMRLIFGLNQNGIVAMDEAFAPVPLNVNSLDQGLPTDTTDGDDHIHISTKQIDDWHEVVATAQEGELYSSDEVAGIAEQIDVTLESYFTLPGLDRNHPRLAEAYRLTDELIDAIFPPEVTEKSADIVAAATEAGIPVNFLASVVTVESAGIADAESTADAHGIIQIVVEFHRERIERIAGQDFESDSEREAYLRDNPDIALRVGADYLAELLAITRQANPGIDPASITVFGIAASAYNSGPDSITTPFTELDEQPQRYRRYIENFYLDVALAAELADSLQLDYSDTKLADAMYSGTIWARAVALSAIDIDHPTQETYDSLAVALPGTDDLQIVDRNIRTSYHLAKAGYDFEEVTRGLSPAMTFWIAHGGSELLNSSSTNYEWTMARDRSVS